MRLLLALVVLFVTFQNFAASLTAEAYGQLPSKSLLAISPSGDKLAYRDTSNGRDLIVVIDANSKKFISAASIEDLNPNSIYFVSEETVILVATKNIKITGYRGRTDSSWAYAFNLENKKIHPLLQQGYGIYKGQGQLGKVVGISPDKEYAYMPAYESPGEYNLYKVNLRKKRKPRIYQRGGGDTTDYFVDGKGEVIARERFNNQKNLHRVEARVNGKWKEIYRKETDIRYIGLQGLTPDYKSLVFRAWSNKTGRKAFYTMRLSDGHIGEAIFQQDNKSVDTLLTSLGRTVYGVKYEGFTPSYEFFSKKLNARMRGISKAMPNNTFTITDYTPDWSQIILYMDGQYSSGDYIKYASGNIGLLASTRPQIPPEAVNDVIEYEFTARDGLTIPTLLTLPKQKSDKPLPAILMPHGGPESYDKKGFNYQAQYFANQGYMVIQPQFRGSEGFGVDFMLKGRGEWGRKMQDDLTDAVNNLVAENKIDKDRVCIVGTSYGGYAALAGAVFTPELYKCVVSINGVSDVERMMKDERWSHGSDHWVVAYWENVISEGEFDDDHLEQISPINHVKNVQAPVLLIHGELDEVVPLRQSVNMFDELEDLNKQVEFIELDRGDHYLSNAQNRVKAMQAISEFVKKHI